MSDDLRRLLTELMQSGTIESATVSLVLKPKPDEPDPPSPVCIIDIGPVSTKE